MDTRSQKIKKEHLRLAKISLAVALACGGFSAQAQNATLGFEQTAGQDGDQGSDHKAQQHVEISGRVGNDSASTKSNASLRDTPLSISVVTADVLQEQGAINLDAAIKNVSGLTQSSSNNYGYFNNYIARGLQVNFLRDGVCRGAHAAPSQGQQVLRSGRSRQDAPQRSRPHHQHGV